MTIDNPCLTCGACCSYYRVSFHWMECDPRGMTGPLPERTVQRDHHQVCMAGTMGKPVRCIELLGQVTQSVSCLIYERRASPCRNFGVQMRGEENWNISAADLEHCNEARAHYNLPAIVPPLPVLPTVPTLGFEPPKPKAA